MRDGSVLVAGGSGGIGAALTSTLAAAGRPVCVLDLVAPLTTHVAGDPERVAARPAAVTCDVTLADSVDEAIATAHNAVGAAAGLVVCVGTDVRGPLIDREPDEIRHILNVNLLGPILLARAFVRQCVGSGDGRIVLIGSDAARVGVEGSATYAAAKAGVMALAKSLALEVASTGTTVNVVSAGSTQAPMLLEAYTSEEIRRRERRIPLGRLATPEDIASAVMFFLSAEASYITGQVLSVNGGVVRLG